MKKGLCIVLSALMIAFSFASCGKKDVSDKPTKIDENGSAYVEVTDKDGNKRRSAEVVADNVYFGDSKRDGGDNSGYNPGYAPAPASHSAAPSNFSASGSDFAEIGEDDGELPF